MCPRARIGAANPKAKLTEDDVRAIRRSSEGAGALAHHYAVGVDTIWSIRARQTWRHIDDASDVPAVDVEPGEEWRPVALRGYTDLYEVSNHGRVRRRNPLLPRPVRKFCRQKFGYIMVVLCRANRQRRVLLHRLVAGAFLGPTPRRRRFVNHMDGDKANNRARNLEYVTRHQNTTHAMRLQLHAFGERIAASKLTERDVIAIRGSRETARVLAARYGVHKCTIYRVKWGTYWRHLH